MKRILAGIALVLAATAALALPTPKDISDAVNSGHLAQAEAMLQEVIKEKPGSAKAHYELGQVLAREGRTIEAKQELLEAQRLAPSLKFTSDPQHFKDLLGKVSAAPAAPLAKAAAGTLLPAVNAAPAPAPAFPWLYLILGGGAILLLWLFMRRSAAAPVMAPAGTSSAGGVMAGGGFGAGPGAYSPPQAAGSGMGGAVLGGIAGLAAGYGLAKVLENSTDSHRGQNSSDASGFIPIDNNASTGNDVFDAGTGDSWDSGDASAGDDNW